MVGGDGTYGGICRDMGGGVGGWCGKKIYCTCEDSAVNFSYRTALPRLNIQNTTDFLPLLLFFHADPAVAGVFAVQVMPSPAVIPCLKLAFLLLLGSLLLPTSLLGKRCVLTV
jgi:hypothetical protein